MSDLNTMQLALINAGLVTEQRATTFNVIQKDKNRRAAQKAAKQAKLDSAKKTVSDFRSNLRKVA